MKKMRKILSILVIAAMLLGLMAAVVAEEEPVVEAPVEVEAPAAVEAAEAPAETGAAQYTLGMGIVANAHEAKDGSARIDTVVVDGAFDSRYVHYDNVAVRPALWIDLNSGIF